MFSTIILTPKIREISYFSSFSEDDKEVTIPRPFINESINYSNIREIKTDTIITFIENRVYIGLENDELIRELLWRLGESRDN